MSRYGDPDALDRLALRLAGEATGVRSRAAELRRVPAHAQWRGRAAAAFAASVLHEAAALDRAAGELDDAAAALRAHAAAVRDTLGRIHALEHAVTGWLAHAEHAVAAPVRHLVAGLPSGAREWLDLPADLRRLGVPL